jgi:hypothetical protein
MKSTKAYVNTAATSVRAGVASRSERERRGAVVMGSSYPLEQRRRRRRGALANGITRMMTNSMALYFAAIFLMRLWELLNSDVEQWIRRV